MLSFYLDTRNKSKNGLYPLKLAVSHNKKRAFLSLPIYLRELEWNPVTQQILRNPTLNARRNDVMARAENVWNELSRDGKLKTMTAIDIRNAIGVWYGMQAKAPSSEFIDGFEEKMDEVTERTRELYWETFKRIIEYVTDGEYCFNDRKLQEKYGKMKKRAIAELKKDIIAEAKADKRVLDLSWESVNEAWLKKFDVWMAGTSKSKNARAIHMRNIRAVFNLAIDNEKTKFYPFRKFKIKKEETIKRSLTCGEIRDLFNKEWDPEFNEAIKVFRLSFMLIGINYVDLFNLKASDIDNHGYLNYRRSKTGKLYRIKLEPEARELIESMKGENWLINQHDRFQSHKDSLQKINIKLHNVGPITYKTSTKFNHLPIKVYNPILPELTTYWSRHSWATMAAQLDVPAETISKALGHSMGSRVTAVYIDFDSRKVDIANRMVLDWVLYGKFSTWGDEMKQLRQQMEQSKCSSYI